MADAVHVLEPHVMTYAWGRAADRSLVAKLSGQTTDPSQKYAELWMGTHANGPACIPAKSMKLKEFLSGNPTALAPHEHGDLQFLFKVLSVAKALSVQSHPTKELARELHARDPKNYPDDNHKPEMTIALTEFEILCGFRKVQEIYQNFSAFPETEKLIGKELLAPLKEQIGDEAQNKLALKQVFSALMNAPTSDVDSVIKAIVARLSDKSDKNALEQLVLRLHGQYPDADVGVLAPLYLNHLKLQPGESVFLGPNEPHAYLDGECIECMACSDNTIRAGLTPKFKDVPTLVSSLTYNTAGPNFLEPKQVVAGIHEYAPPIPEFSVQKVTADARALNDTHASSILIVVAGCAKIGSVETRPGTVVFVEAAAAEVPLLHASPDFLAFRAFTPTP